MAETAFPGDALAIAWHPHHVEHLAPWCEIMGMPMLVDARPETLAAARCYPGLAFASTPGLVATPDLRAFAREARARAPRVVFVSELFERWHLRELFGGARPARVVYVPHGFSEKRQDWARETAYQDVAVLYGEHAYDQLLDFGVAAALERPFFSGDVRRAYHRRHAAHFRASTGALAALPRAERTLLYAPTWTDAIRSSSFFDAFAAFVEGMPASWCLIAKLHPRLERHADVIDTLALRARGRDVHLVRGSPLTHPWLDLADAYVGDMSALAYDFLASGRPMFFTNATAGTAADAKDSRLFGCGTVIPPERYGDLARIVDEAWNRDAGRYGEARRALDRYTHAPERGVDDLRAAMREATAGPAPAWMHAPAMAASR